MMIKFHHWLVLSLISCLITTGCQHDSPATTVVEYRPAATPTEKKAPDSEVFVLWRWRAVVPVTTRPTTEPSKQFAIEVQQVYAERGSPIGFRRSDSNLIAVAGSTTIPLEDAHYAWRTLRGSSTRDQNRQQRIDRIFTTAGVVLAVVLITVLVLALVHEDRHSLLQDVFDSN